MANYVKPSNFSPPPSTSNPTQARRRVRRGLRAARVQRRGWRAAPGHDFLKRLEFCITYGNPFLFEAVEEALDPIIDPVLERQFTYETGRRFIRLGDKLVEWDDAWGRPGGGDFMGGGTPLLSLFLDQSRNRVCPIWMHGISSHNFCARHFFLEGFSSDRPQPQVPAVPVHEDQSPQLPPGSLR